MKRLFTILLAFTSLATGCVKENKQPQDKPTPESKFLVIQADCAQIAKSDITNGVSSWEKGDIIEVVYKGRVYEYRASESGTDVYFTSESGIYSYDGSPISAYYNAMDSEEGLIGVEAEKSISFTHGTQATSARIPLVGTSISVNDEEGVMKISFANVFSVLELKIDATLKKSGNHVKTITIEPADGADFNGFLSCTGTVDPNTLAIDTQTTGNTITLAIPSGMDITIAQTLKFPIGRFSSDKGLKFTIRFDNEDTYEKTLFKNGISTFEESDGKIIVKHIIKTMYSLDPTYFSGGDGTEENPFAIACVQDLADLSEYVASGDTDFLSFRTAHYIQIEDIDFNNETLNSIGNSNNAEQYSSFCGKYDGNGYKVSNVVINNPKQNMAVGFFGYLDGEAHIRNLKLDNVTINSTTWNVATIVGCVQSTATLGLVEGCTVTNASVTSSDSAVGGIVGKLMTGTIKNCSFQGNVSGGGEHVGGITGQIMNTSLISGCSFDTGTVNQTSADRNQCGGIVGYIDTSLGTVENCNFGGTVNTEGGNVGGIAGAMNGESTIKDCIVTGKVSGNQWTGGIVGWQEAGYIKSCTLENAIIVGTKYTGGITGFMPAGTIEGCILTKTTIEGNNSVGGIAGEVNSGASITSCQVNDGTITNADQYTGGIGGMFNTGGIISRCSLSDTEVSGLKNTGGILGAMTGCTDAKESKIEDCNVTGGSATTQLGYCGGIIGYSNTYGIINRCSASCDVTNNVSLPSSDNGCIGGIAGYLNSDTSQNITKISTLIANCIYYEGKLQNNRSEKGGVGGIVGGLNTQKTELTDGTIVNCASFPEYIYTYNTHQNIAGIVGYICVAVLKNCYSPTPESKFSYGVANDRSSRGTLFGWLRGLDADKGELSAKIINGYWLSGFKAGNLSGSWSYDRKEQELTDAQMRNTGSVTMPSTGTVYPCFLDALNAGADEYNLSKVHDVAAEKWVMGTNGYPVISGCPIASN